MCSAARAYKQDMITKKKKKNISKINHPHRKTFYIAIYRLYVCYFVVLGLNLTWELEGTFFLCVLKSALFKPWVIPPNNLFPFPLLLPLYNKNKVFALRIRLTTGYFNMPQQPLSLPFTSCHVSISAHVNQSHLSFIKHGSNIQEINITIKGNITSRSKEM